MVIWNKPNCCGVDNTIFLKSNILPVISFMESWPITKWHENHSLLSIRCRFLFDCRNSGTADAKVRVRAATKAKSPTLVDIAVKQMTSQRETQTMMNIHDLESTKELDHKAMEAVSGGYDTVLNVPVHN